MRVFFTTPHPLPDSYQPFIDKALAALKTRKVTVIRPGDTDYKKTVASHVSPDSLEFKRSHYRFILQGIAAADAVIIEASHQDFRVGHEATLALLYGKPVLVLSRYADYAEYIPHELLSGSHYTDKRELNAAIHSFIDRAAAHLSSPDEIAQTVEASADSLHAASLATIRREALRDTGEFGKWARLAEANPEKTRKAIHKSLGELPAGKPWSVFASIYNEDTPDYVFSGAARFAGSIFSQRGIGLTDRVVDVACGTGAISRNLITLGYRNILAFDNSREMLGEAFLLCAHLPSVKLFEADIANVHLENPVKGMVWFDFSSNFALDELTLKGWIENLLDNMDKGGCLIFDVRTVTGWQVGFYRQPVTTYATANFQRIWFNQPNYDKNTIKFDIFIRTRTAENKWSEWRREQMQERMWSLNEVKKIVKDIKTARLEAIFGDDFAPIENDEEPGLAYFVITKK